MYLLVNIALCILLFVFISKLIILPSTYHRHKLTLLAPKIEPEVKEKIKNFANYSVITLDDLYV